MLRKFNSIQGSRESVPLRRVEGGGQLWGALRTQDFLGLAWPSSTFLTIAHLFVFFKKKSGTVLNVCMMQYMYVHKWCSSLLGGLGGAKKKKGAEPIGKLGVSKQKNKIVAATPSRQ